MTEKLLGALKEGIVFIVSAPAGTGKTTLVHMLVDEFHCVRQSISYTTRKKRLKEIEGEHYHFITEAEFDERKKDGDLLEHAEVFGNSYGTSRSAVESQTKEGNHVILVIDTQGALELKNQGYEAVYIFIEPPNMAELRKRLFKRGTEEKTHIEDRLERAEKELSFAPEYDYRIINDNLHSAYETLRSILIAEEHKKERYDKRKLHQ